VNNFKVLTSEELMDLYANKSPEEAYKAFEELYYRFNKRVYFYALKKLNNRSESEDAVQKIFLKLHECKHLFNGKFKFEQWIFVIAKTSIIDILRKQKSDLKKIEQLINDFDASLPDDDRGVGIIDEFERLDNDQKVLLELKYVDELSYKEISQILSKSEVSIRKSVSRLVLKLRNGGIS
jgi:RNA polymerase sigma-70 factor (ECF subfamily)